jgi:hypothetical protein
MLNKDYIIYCDTDSLFIDLNSFILKTIPQNIWDNLNDEKKISYIKEICKVVIKYLNDKSFFNTQKEDFNSQEEEFKINFKQELIAQSGLFIAKKKYGLWVVDDEGAKVDKLKVTGLDIIRSECPEIVRDKLKNIMTMILKDVSDHELSLAIEKYKNELHNALPEEIAANIGINGISKYTSKQGTPKKGAPYHVKGAIAYRKLIRELNIQDKYEDIAEGAKAKVVYVKKNKYEYETIAFYRWPKEFASIGVEVDMTKMITNFFTKKIEYLLLPIKKAGILTINDNAFSKFFKQEEE